MIRFSRKLLVLALTALCIVACSESSSGEPAHRDTVYRIGIINPDSALNDYFEEFRVAMAELGYREGENIAYTDEAPIASFAELLTLPAELVAEDVDLIITAGNEVGLVVQNNTNDIPILVIALNDPVGAGLVEDLARPGGNITGITIGDIHAKRLELLLEAVPGIATIYVPYDPSNFQARRSYEQTLAAAETINVAVITCEIASDAHADVAIDEFPSAVDAIFLVEDRFTTTDRRWQQLALELRIPIAVPGAGTEREYDYFLGYGLRPTNLARQSARMADVILRGTPPGELPVENAEALLMIDLITAEAIGIQVPDYILQIADIVYRPEESGP